MRVALVTGSRPPDPCGVGAYVERLAESLQERGVDAEVVVGTAWRLNDTWRVRRRVDRLRPDVVHIQYPTLGYGANLGPHALSIVRPSVVTLHELRYTHLLRRAAVAAFAFSAEHVVLTTDHERSYLLRFAPWLRRRSSVIPVGSSIPAPASLQNGAATEVVHFGLVRPEKGLEQVVELARLMGSSGSSLRVHVVGDVIDKWRGYFDSLVASSANLPLTWETGLTPAAVADVLARSRLAYLPFPDGASDRRTSLLAILASATATITTRGPETPAALAEAVAFADDPADALRIAEQLSVDAATADRLAAAGVAYARRFDWNEIAARHTALYEDVVRGRGARRREMRRRRDAAGAEGR